MKYTEFRDQIKSELESRPSGMTWKDLKKSLGLPYERPCPEWTKSLEMEIGLVRRKNKGGASIWTIEKEATGKDPVFWDHIGIFATDVEKSIIFFEKCLAPLGIRIRERQEEWNSVIFSGAAELPFLWLGPCKGDYYGTKLKKSASRPIHLAFVAPSIKAVRAFYRLGLKYGGRDNGIPEDNGNRYYAAFLLDPDGNNIEAGIKL